MLEGKLISPLGPTGHLNLTLTLTQTAEGLMLWTLPDHTGPTGHLTLTLTLNPHILLKLMGLNKTTPLNDSSEASSVSHVVCTLPDAPPPPCWLRPCPAPFQAVIT